ncbi:hypothetical protein KEM55_005714, partial [Ascosphaera atra]
MDVKAPNVIEGLRRRHASAIPAGNTTKPKPSFDEEEHKRDDHVALLSSRSTPDSMTPLVTATDTNTDTVEAPSWSIWQKISG